MLVLLAFVVVLLVIVPGLIFGLAKLISVYAPTGAGARVAAQARGDAPPRA